MRVVTLFLFAAVAAAAPVPKALKKRPDAEVFVGTWDVVKSELGGQPRNKGTVWTFETGDEDGVPFLRMTSRKADEPNATIWKIKIDPEKSPKEIDIGNYKGIYEFDGGDIRVAYILGGERPTTFDAKPNVYYALLRRAAEKK